MSSLLALLVVWSGVAVAQEVEIDPGIAGDRARLKAVQANLNAIGFDVGRPDGVFGKGSTRGFAAFINQFRADGRYVLDDETEAYLAKAALAYAGDPWKDTSSFNGILPQPVETTWDARDKVGACKDEQCMIYISMLAAGDMTGDGRNEIVYQLNVQTANGDDRNAPNPIVIMSPAAGGRFVPLDVESEAEHGIWRVHARFAVVRDFNGDGIGDLFVAAHGYDYNPYPGEQNVLVLSSPEGLVDRSHTHLPVQSDFAHGTDAADLDGDGDQDIVVITNFGAKRIDNYVLWNDGTGRFTQAGLGTILTESLAYFLKPGLEDRSKYTNIKIADVDRDGNLDLLLLVSGDDAERARNYPGLKYTRLIFGDGSGKWSRDNAVELVTPRWGYSTYATDAALPDLDDDGDADIVLSLNTVDRSRPGADSWRGLHIQALRNDGDKFVDVTPDLMFPQGYDQRNVDFPWHVTAEDLNLDGRPDFVVGSLGQWNPCAELANQRAGLVAISEPDGTYRPLDSRDVGVKYCAARNLVAFDHDGDGDIDIIGTDQLGKVYPNGDYRSFGLIVQVHLNDPSRPARPKPAAMPELPKAEYVVRTVETESLKPGPSIQVDSVLKSEIDGVGKSQSRLSFIIGGEFNYAEDVQRFRRLQFVLAEPIDSGVTAALSACNARTEVWGHDGSHHVLIEFSFENGVYKAKAAECIVAALPKKFAFQVEFLTGHFTDVAIGMASTGELERIANDGLRTFMRRVALGELTVTR